MGVIRRNIVWLGVSQVFTWVMTLLVLGKIPDALGNEFGGFAYAACYVGFFALLACLGCGAYIGRAVARDDSVVGHYVFNAVLMKLVLVAVLAAAAIGLSVLLGNSTQTRLLIGIGCLGMLLQALGDVFAGALGGMQRVAKPALWVTVQVYVQALVGLYVVVVLGGGVVAFAAVMTFSSAIPVIAWGVMLWPRVRGHMRLDGPTWRRLFVGGVPLVMVALFTMIYGTVDVFILHQMAGDRDVSWYAVAQRWSGLPMFVASAVVASYMASLSANGNPVTPQFAPLVNRATRLVSMVTLPGAVGLALVASDLLHFAHGHSFDEAIPATVILSFGIPLIALDTVLASALIAAQRMNRYIAVAVIAAVVNPLGCVVLIDLTLDRYDNGAIATALMSVATELIVLVGALRFRLPGVLDRPTVGNLARIAIAAAAMAPVVVAANDLPVVVQAVLGAVTYAGALVAFGAVSRDELTSLESQARSARLRLRGIASTLVR